MLEFGGGAGGILFFAAEQATHVWCAVIQADALEYLAREPGDVVIGETLHVGLLREEQLAVIEGFKERYEQ